MIALVATSPLYGVFKYAFDALQKKKQVIAFWLSVPLVILMFVVTLRTLVVPAPNLVPNLEMLAYGGIGSMKVENQNPVAIVDTITNSGNMPSVVTDFHLTATLHGRIYEALRIAMPDIISLSDKNNSGTVRYLGTDALYERGTHAISPGGLVAGVLLFNFSQSIRRLNRNRKARYDAYVSGRSRARIHAANPHWFGALEYSASHPRYYSANCSSGRERPCLSPEIIRCGDSRCHGAPIRVHAGKGDPFVKRPVSVVLLEPVTDARRRRE